MIPKSSISHKVESKLRGPEEDLNKPPYLEVESKMAGLGLLQVTLGVFQAHLQAMCLGLDLTQLCLLPLGLHLFLKSGEGELDTTNQ